jgi:hypothetical protein
MLLGRSMVFQLFEQWACGKANREGEEGFLRRDCQSQGSMDEERMGARAYTRQQEAPTTITVAM